MQRSRLTFITELHRSRNQSIFRAHKNENNPLSFSNPETTASTQSTQALAAAENRRSTTSTDTATQGILDEYGAGVIKVGLLIKTSKGRSSGSRGESSVNIRPGITRQRRFRLTEEALEYFHYFSQVGIIILHHFWVHESVNSRVHLIK